MIAEHFGKIEDPREPWKIKHDMLEIITIVILATLAGCDAWEEIEDFCKVKENWFKERVKLKLWNGIPSHDTLQRVFGMIDPSAFETSFQDWMAAVFKKTDGEIISVDGKTLRGSKDGKKRPLHMVSAWANANQMVLGQVPTDEKSNEIKAVPELLDLLDIKGCIITADAMSCQKEITGKVTEKEADYVFALKENQPNLYEDVRMYYEDVLSHPRHHKDEVEKVITTDKGHGRIEKRTYYLISNVDWIENRSAWSNLNGIGMVKSRVDTNGIITEDTRYYITSLTNAALFAKAARAHWGIENSLHWCLDVVFNEDHIRMRKDHTAENMAVVRHIVLNVLKSFPTEKKMSVARKRKRCYYDQDFLASVLEFMVSVFHA